MAANQDHMKKKVALIVGVTGMAGLALAEALKSPTSLGGPWEVYGASRRAKPTWFPSSIVDHYITFDALDSENTCSKLASLSGHITHVFWVAIQVREKEQQKILVNSHMLSNVLNVLLTLPPQANKPRIRGPSTLRHITIQTGTQQYMGPIQDPILSTQLPKPDIVPFNENATRLPYPNFYYALEDLVASYVPKITFSIHRSSIILGASSRSFYNMLLTVGVYAEICKYEHTPFKYPGTQYTWNHFCDVSDSRLLAEQQIWAAVASQDDSKKVKNEAFNCTNGDVFTWRSMWMVLCEVFGVEFVEFKVSDDDGRFDWVGTMNEKGRVWDRIVMEKGLYRTKMEEITCFPAANFVLHFEFQHVCSMNKSKELGFLGFVDSLKSVRFWVRRLREMNILPQLIETEAEPVQ